MQGLCCGSPTQPAPAQLPPAQAADRRNCFYSWGWVFPQGHAPPQLQVNREMHPCQLLLCTAVLSCARAPILLLWMGERTKAADVLSEPGEVLASRAASQLPCLLPCAANLPAYHSIWPFPTSERTIVQARDPYRTLPTLSIPGPCLFKCCHLKMIPSKLLFLLLHVPVGCPRQSDLVARGKPILAQL